jgi:uncharacterized protein (TIGR03437 family)
MKPGQWSAEFRIDAVSPMNVDSAVITAQLGSDTALETLGISAGGQEKLTVRDHLYSRYGTEVEFQVSSSEAGATLSVDTLPSGATFDPLTATFDWIPNSQQQGTYVITFTATGPAGDITNKSTTLDIDSGAPVVKRVVNSASQSNDAVCSANSLASIEGRWLAIGVDSPSASLSVPLVGPTVRIDGIAVSLVSTSPTRLDFLCPDLASGASHTITVEAAQGTTSPLAINFSRLTPGIFSIDRSGSGQGVVIHAEDSTLAMVRNYKHDDRPAQVGDHLVIYSTGISGAMQVLVNLGGIEVKQDSVTENPQHVGVFQVAFTVPQGVPSAESVNLFLAGIAWDGSTTNSNPVTISIEN